MIRVLMMKIITSFDRKLHRISSKVYDFRLCTCGSSKAYDFRLCTCGSSKAYDFRLCTCGSSKAYDFRLCTCGSRIQEGYHIGIHRDVCNR